MGIKLEPTVQPTLRVELFMKICYNSVNKFFVGVIMLHFKFLDKNKFSLYSKDIFLILANNMSMIAPTGNDFEDDFTIWHEAVENGLKHDTRKIILIYFDNELIGFFQYYTNVDIFVMEEIQIISKMQGKENIFRSLYGFIFSVLPPQIKIVEAYANKTNHKSQNILTKLGLSIIGENKNGNSYHYRGDFANLLNWYYSKE